MRTRFFHFRVVKNNQIQRKGGATISYEPVDENNGKIGISVCSHKDDFSPKKGRTVAAGRGKKYGEVVSYDSLRRFMDPTEILRVTGYLPLFKFLSKSGCKLMTKGQLRARRMEPMT